MTKPVDAPGLPPLGGWDTDGPGDLSRPDASFHDDHVGGRIKSDEAARLRGVADRFLQEQPKRIVDEGLKVAQAEGFRPTHQDEAKQRALREQSRQARQSRRRGAAVTGQARPMTEQEQDVERVEQRVEIILASMEALGRVLGDEPPPSEPGDDTEAEPEAAHPKTKRAALSWALQTNRMAKLEREAKYQLQHLMAGGVGMTLMADPRLTFRRLFARITAWPKAVRPGYRPETEEDINAFLAWAFEPVGGYEAMEPF